MNYATEAERSVTFRFINYSESRFERFLEKASLSSTATLSFRYEQSSPQRLRLLIVWGVSVHVGFLDGRFINLSTFISTNTNRNRTSWQTSCNIKLLTDRPDSHNNMSSYKDQFTLFSRFVYVRSVWVDTCFVEAASWQIIMSQMWTAFLDIQ